jgi:hypothetical protein
MTNISWTNVAELHSFWPQKLIKAESSSHGMCEQLVEVLENAEKIVAVDAENLSTLLMEFGGARHNLFDSELFTVMHNADCQEIPGQN